MTPGTASLIPLARTAIPRGDVVRAATQALREPRERILAAWSRECAAFLQLPMEPELAGTARRLLTRAVRQTLAGGGTTRVLLPAFACPTVAWAVRQAGGEPTPVDVDPATGVMDPVAARRALERAPVAALVAVPLFGATGELPAIVALARSRGVPVIADCAQAFAPGIANELAGAAAWLFSFGAGKSLPLFGGGALFAAGKAQPFDPGTADTRFDPDTAATPPGAPEPGPAPGVEGEWRVLSRACLYSLMWRPRVWRPLVTAAARQAVRPEGEGPRAFPTASAALGLRLLPRLAREQAARRHNAALWRQELIAATETVGTRCGGFRALDAGTESGAPPLRFALCVPADRRDALLQALWQRGVWASATDYGTGRAAAEFPGATELNARLVTLPVHEGVTAADIRRMVAWLVEEETC